MGITDFTVGLLKNIFEQNPGIKSVCELGDQQTYVNGERYGQYANWFYEQYGVSYLCVDINGNNGAWQLDLSKPNKINIQYDLVTDFGVSEHVEQNSVFSWEAIYNCWKTKFDLLKIDGILANENPKHGNWPGHGYNYYDTNFYLELSNISGLYIQAIGEWPAMGNTTDGFNVWCIMEKVSNMFPSLDRFKQLSLHQK